MPLHSRSQKLFNSGLRREGWCYKTCLMATIPSQIQMKPMQKYRDDEFKTTGSFIEAPALSSPMACRLICRFTACYLSLSLQSLTAMVSRLASAARVWLSEPLHPSFAEQGIEYMESDFSFAEAAEAAEAIRTAAIQWVGILAAVLCWHRGDSPSLNARSEDLSYAVNTSPPWSSCSARVRMPLAACCYYSGRTV